MKITLVTLTFYLFMISPLPVFSAPCTLPSTLSGKLMILELDGQYTHNNPRAGELQEFSFSKTQLTERSLHTGETLSGKYSYQVLAADIALITTTLMQQDTLVSSFELTLMCQDEKTGRYIFSQSQGSEAPVVRQNVGSYFFMPN
ncbi:hypothetical protein [uncultured Shewanella sp.]|uniref:hypothetical protein n=1 Tax=uncultured Shewanella sp. TaxID=173975 RepID=UPI0026196E9C|nr:hypothetical protein [uncultured Shewanella sp.]